MISQAGQIGTNRDIVPFAEAGETGQNGTHTYRCVPMSRLTGVSVFGFWSCPDVRAGFWVAPVFSRQAPCLPFPFLPVPCSTLAASCHTGRHGLPAMPCWAVSQLPGGTRLFDRRLMMSKNSTYTMAQVREVIARVSEQFPTAFPDVPVPLAIGISDQLVDAGFPLPEVKMALRHWCGRARYHKAIIAGQARVNLDGSESDVPTQSHVERAKRRLAESGARARAKAEKAARAETKAKKVAVEVKVDPPVSRVPTRPVLSLKKVAA